MSKNNNQSSKQKINICIFSGSTDSFSKEYFDFAIELGQLLALNNYNIIYGGSIKGLSGIIANSAIRNNGKVIGITPKNLIGIEGPNKEANKSLIVESIMERKSLMEKMSDVFVVFPGGLGTLDEFFEIITLKMVHAHNKKILFLNINNYWEPLFAMIRHITNEGFSRSNYFDLFNIFNNPSGLVDYLNAWYNTLRS